jgi:hypothetical protein
MNNGIVLDWTTETNDIFHIAAQVFLSILTDFLLAVTLFFFSVLQCSEYPQAQKLIW